MQNLREIRHFSDRCLFFKKDARPSSKSRATVGPSLSSPQHLILYFVYGRNENESVEKCYYFFNAKF